jgi:hypothetical protein
MELIKGSGVVVGGIVTSIAVAVVVTAIEAFTGFSIYTWSIWIFVPVGAAFCGLFAASGYFIAAKYLQQQPGRALLLQMILVAGLTQFLIYWFEYLVVIGFSFRGAPRFLDYLQYSLTNAHYIFRHGSMKGDPGAVGEAGYVLAALQFIGFAAGGAAVYLKLDDQPKCIECRKYLVTTGSRKDSFADEEAFFHYYDNEFIHPLDSTEFAEFVGPPKEGRGRIKLTTKLLQCPQCGEQTVSETVAIGGQQAGSSGLDRMVPIPVGVDVKSAYFGKE